MNNKKSNVKKIQKTAAISLAVNILLTALKFACGIIGKSQVMMADAVHTLSDTITDVAVFAGSEYWSKPPDKEHPYGHRRIETLITIFISLSLAFVGLALAYNGLICLLEGNVQKTGWIAFIAAIISLFSKEILFRWSFAIGKKTGSSALIANAHHQRSDALSSIPAAIAVAASAINPKLWFLDDIGAIVIAFFIMNIAWQIGCPALAELIDTGAPQKDLEYIKALTLQINGVRDAHMVRTRYVGSGIQTDLHILVDPEITVRKSHMISDAVKHQLISKGPNIIDAVIHVEPYEEGK
jgi:cation diffusion facilitator family transporter